MFRFLLFKRFSKMKREIENITVLIPSSEKSQIPSLGFAAIKNILSQAYPEIAVSPVYTDSDSALDEADIVLANFYSTLGFIDLQKTLIRRQYFNDKRKNPFVTVIGGTGSLNPLPIKDSVNYVASNEKGLIGLISHLTGIEPEEWERPSPIWASSEYISLIMPTLSCVYDCVFCQLKNQNDGNVQNASVESVKRIIAENRPKRVLIHSANILRYQHFDRLIEVLQESKAEIYLGSMNLSDINEQRARNLFRLKPKHTIASERDIDTQLYFGLESGSKRVLKNMRKPLTPEIALQKIKILNEAGFKHLGFYLIVGYPETEEQDFNYTANLLNAICDIMGEDKKISVKCTPFIPHLGTEASNQPARYWGECKNELGWIKGATRSTIEFDISDPFYYLTSLAPIRGGSEHHKLVHYLASCGNAQIRGDEDMEKTLRELRLPDLYTHLTGRSPIDLSRSRKPFVNTGDL